MTPRGVAAHVATPFLLLLLLASPAAALSPLAIKGRAVVRATECNRCHPISGADGVAAAHRDFHCVDCHTWILSSKGDDAVIAERRRSFPDWDRYLENIVHFIELPDLGTLTRRVDPAFVRRFLDGPFDLRPHLDESMVPLRLSPADKDALVAYLTELNGDAAVKPGTVAPAQIPPERVTKGRERFVASGCVTCHVVGNARLMPGVGAPFYAAMRETARLAPNLRFVRERIPRPTLVRFIRDPKAVDPKTAMPTQPVTDADAEAIADFLLGTPVELLATPAAARPEVPKLARKVTYDEVFDEVLGKICVHCHMHPESNNGDGGAGNTGGLGYAGLSLDLETYDGVKAGLVRGGKRVSVLDGDKPLLLEALLRRHEEADRDVRALFGDRAELGRPTSPELPGMPLGLPPLTMEQMSLVKTWLAQGAPGP